MSWAARLEIDIRRDGPRCVARDRREGPLRALKTLYPEGDNICHQVIVHPPGGIVGGATALQPQVVVLRALAHRVEPAMALARAVRMRWREALWQLAAPPLGVWRT